MEFFMTGNSISKVIVSVLDIPFHKPITSALGTYEGFDYVVVELQTSDGISGYGYSMSLDRRGTKAVVSYIETELIPLMLFQKIDSPEDLWFRLWSPNKVRMRGGVGVHALSAVDTAVWDAAAKYSGLPLNLILGGNGQKVPVYGSGGWLSMSNSELVEEALRYAEMGVPAYKLKIGGEHDQERLKLLRRETGDNFTLYVDANQTYSAEDAINAAEWLSDYNVAWLEEPVLADCPWELEKVAAKSKVPLAAGENVYFNWGFQDLCNRQAVEYLQPDVGRCGGVTEWIKIARLADANDLRLTSHLLHEVSACLINPFTSGVAVEFMNLFQTNPFTWDYSVTSGHITLPELAGHGVEFSHEAKKKYTV